jgi:hypothetical protein
MGNTGRSITAAASAAVLLDAVAAGSTSLVELLGTQGGGGDGPSLMAAADGTAAGASEVD